MKIALIGDVHANLPALEAVLTHAEENKVEKIWNIGDSVGYGAFPDEVVRLIQKKKVLSILGNYDRTVLKVKKKSKKWADKKIPEKWLAFNWAYDHLSLRSRRYLRSLPEQRRIKLSGWRVLLTHASPASREEHLTQETPEDRLKELSQMTRADIVVVGHSHVPFARCVDGVWFINTGSVGRPDDGDPRTSYAHLVLSDDHIAVIHYRIPYPLNREVKALKKQKLPDEFVQMTIQGRSLDDILAQQRVARVNSAFSKKSTPCDNQIEPSSA